MKLSSVKPPSKWLKVPDIDEAGGHMDLTIKAASWDTFQDGRPSLELEFIESEKVFGCNATNRGRLQFFFGEEIEETDLIGKVIRIGKELTEDPKTRKPIWGSRVIAGKGARPLNEMVAGATPSDAPPTDLNAPEVPTYDELNPPPPTDDDNVGFADDEPF